MIEHGPLLERLLAGEFICAITDEHGFNKLSQDTVQKEMDHYLRPLNRRVATNEDQSVYFLSYQTIDDTARKHLTHEFTQTVQSLLPMLEFMQLVQEAQGIDSTLSAGDIIKQHEFSLKVEDNQSLKLRLHQLASSSLFKSVSESPEQQIKLVFKRVKELGYFHQVHKDRLVYQVTGKIEHLIELVRFIKDEENILLDEVKPEQGDMF